MILENLFIKLLISVANILKFVKRAYSRIGNAYCKMKDLQKALKSYEQSLSYNHNSDIFKKKHQIEKELTHEKENIEQSDASIRKTLAKFPNLLSEKQAKKIETSNCLQGENLTLMNTLLEKMMSLSPSSTKELNFIDKRIRSFELDKYPVECDVVKCKRRLNEHYENTRARNMGLMMIKSNKIKNGPSQHFELLRRLGNSLAYDWYFKSDRKLGDIFSTDDMVLPYDPRVLHSFSNEVNRAEVLTPGTVHVSVGFTDLGELHTAKYEFPLDSEKPLRWIGYESSAYCVAKTAILVAMMKLGLPCDHVLQVWYSAAWSNETLKSFRTTVNHLLNSNSLIC